MVPNINKCVGELLLIGMDPTMHSMDIMMEGVVVLNMLTSLDSASHMDLLEHTFGHLLAEHSMEQEGVCIPRHVALVTKVTPIALLRTLGMTTSAIT